MPVLMIRFLFTVKVPSSWRVPGSFARVSLMSAAEMDSAKRFDHMLLEAALYHPPNACKAQSDHEEQGPNTLTKPDGNGRIIEEQQEGPDTGFPSETPAGESDEGANTKGSGRAEKKRKERAKNWGDEETMNLLEAVDPQKKKTKSRFDQGNDTEPSYWECTAKKVRDRTGDECRRRMETLKKSYKTSRSYCEKMNKKFTELTAEDFEKMKLATRITESWYNHIRDHCPPRPDKKMMRDEGVGSPLVNADHVYCGSTSGGVGSLPAGFQNSVAESMQLVMAMTPVSAIQSKRALETFGVEVCVLCNSRLIMVVSFIKWDAKNWVFVVRVNALLWATSLKQLNKLKSFLCSV
ncbi:hypothetical protein KC19_6G196100 [Ceratodon purpureus]|uniref:Myb-like domain-containing protein n=1 Tax=Ceratodon purpureus TaxID=3225 RepID=A0A8T0HJD2_CERPU|nr:hypothetical protein KC19_6G196100 [Ceratodon purpureus]